MKMYYTETKNGHYIIKASNSTQVQMFREAHSVEILFIRRASLNDAMKSNVQFKELP